MDKKSKIWLSVGLATAVVLSAGGAFAANSTATDNQQQAQQQDGHHEKAVWKADIKNNQELLQLLKTDAATLQKELKSGKSVADIAAAAGVSEQLVIDLLVKQATAKIDEAVKAGKLTQERADQMKSKLPDRIKQIVEHKGPFGGKEGHHKGGAPLKDAAAVLGMEPKDLMEQLKSGKSIKQVAEEKGMTEQQVIDALLQKAKDRITKFVEKSDWELKGTSEQTPAQNQQNQ
ncbi:hypothetical protein [Effusibacillus pohliae]|uniref:hypothetical protein n=1 Tax=Effusibacillus pohliae TaxID=232270 RepID=UPI00037B4F0A|nr:hypothetical protein [Effusibacillus pohliae]